MDPDVILIWGKCFWANAQKITSVLKKINKWINNAEILHAAKGSRGGGGTDSLHYDSIHMNWVALWITVCAFIIWLIHFVTQNDFLQGILWFWVIESE